MEIRDEAAIFIHKFVLRHKIMCEVYDTVWSLNLVVGFTLSLSVQLQPRILCMNPKTIPSFEASHLLYLHLYAAQKDEEIRKSWQCHPWCLLCWCIRYQVILPTDDGVWNRCSFISRYEISFEFCREDTVSKILTRFRLLLTLYVVSFCSSITFRRRIKWRFSWNHQRHEC